MPRLHKNVKNVCNESSGFITLKELKKGNEYLKVLVLSTEQHSVLFSGY